MPQDLKATRSLEESLTIVRARLGSCLNQVELLTVAAPFCAPALELVRDDLREALAVARDAAEVERKIVDALAGPSTAPWRPRLVPNDGAAQ
jgi:hypothetical protein